MGRHCQLGTYCDASVKWGIWKSVNGKMCFDSVRYGANSVRYGAMRCGVCVSECPCSRSCGLAVRCDTAWSHELHPSRVVLRGGEW